MKSKCLIVDAGSVRTEVLIDLLEKYDAVVVVKTTVDPCPIVGMIDEYGVDDIFFFQMANGKFLNLKLQDIQCIEGRGNHSFVTYCDGQEELCYSLSDFEKLLPPSKFVRVHHSYIVCLRCVKYINFGKKQLTLYHSMRSKPITIGRTYKARLRKIVDPREFKQRRWWEGGKLW